MRSTRTPQRVAARIQATHTLGHNSRMPWSHDPTFMDLRLRYKAASDAHQQRHRALTEAGENPPAGIREAEERARLQMSEARTKLLEAMARATTERGSTT